MFENAAEPEALARKPIVPYPLGRVLESLGLDPHMLAGGNPTELDELLPPLTEQQQRVEAALVKARARTDPLLGPSRIHPTTIPFQRSQQGGQ